MKEIKEIKESKQNLKLGQIVFLGSTKLANMDLYDYLRDITSFSIYNESVPKLKIEDLEKCVEMISNLQPSKLFISIGEEEIKNEKLDIDDFISKYEWFLYKINQNCKNCTLYIISLNEENDIAKKVNKRLQKLSEECGCRFIKLIGNSICDFISTIKVYLRKFPINFVEAMRYS